jgi:hypothetical protein
MRLMHLSRNLDSKFSLNASFLFLEESCLLNLVSDFNETLYDCRVQLYSALTDRHLRVLLHSSIAPIYHFLPYLTYHQPRNHAYIVVHLVSFSDIYPPCYIARRPIFTCNRATKKHYHVHLRGYRRHGLYMSYPDAQLWS